MKLNLCLNNVKKAMTNSGNFVSFPENLEESLIYRGDNWDISISDKNS